MDCDTANVYDGSHFQHIVEGVNQIVFADESGWFPPNLRICQRGEWNDRMLIETILSILPLEESRASVLGYFKTRLAFTMAVFNLLVQWEGLPVERQI